jgi:hypothetical protein
MAGKSVTFKAGNATDGNGGDFILEAGKPTGANTGSNVIFKTYASSSDETTTENMRIKNNGNVGIGTNNPTTRLKVVASLDNGNAIAEFDGASTGNKANFISVKNSDGGATAIFGCCPDNVDDGGIGICNSSSSGSGNINFYRQDGGLTQLAKISTESNEPTLTIVGGTGSKPALRLQRGDWGSDNYTDWQLRDEDGHLYFSKHSGNSSTDNVTFLSGGLVGINRNNSVDNEIRGGLDVNTYGPEQAVTYGWFNNTGTGGTASGNIAYGIYTPHRILGAEFNAISDDRLKEQEEYITDATQTLLKLRPQIYYKKPTFDSPNDTWFKEAGLIAQEVFYDAPELRYVVSTGINPSEIPDTPPDGYNNSDPSIDPDYSNWGETPANIKYNNLIPYLIKSNQELHARILALESNIPQ